MVLATFFPASARAEDAIQLESVATCKTEAGSTFVLHPGLYITEEVFDRLEARYIQTEDRVTRLLAENKALKEYEPPMSNHWAVGVLTLSAVLAGHYIWK